MIKHSAAALILGLFLIFKLDAANVSFVVIETGTPLNADQIQHSWLWESALMDVFFNDGYIVTNSPITRLGTGIGDLQRITKAELDQAEAGGADYLVVALLNYVPGSADSLQWPREVSLQLFSVASREKIFEQKIAGQNYRTAREIFDNLRTISGGLVSHLNDR